MVGPVASRGSWLSPHNVICLLAEELLSPRAVSSRSSLDDVSVTASVLQGGVVGPTPNPQPGGPGAAFRPASTLKPARHGCTYGGYEYPPALLIDLNKKLNYSNLATGGIESKRLTEREREKDKREGRK
ncbi:unnamed protein product [Pleuronectes platessa]|uniref:Uncharacterized protein n=1 Tax=Pleuronectes platessa TaxID=8262 RepID=A0A9N7YCE5_PLEPL|nr:unnamed protein product [Pleuronectes platessa]